MKTHISHDILNMRSIYQALFFQNMWPRTCSGSLKVEKRYSNTAHPFTRIQFIDAADSLWGKWVRVFAVLGSWEANISLKSSKGYRHVEGVAEVSDAPECLIPNMTVCSTFQAAL